MTCWHYWFSQLEHRGMTTWLNYIIGHPRINIELQYIRYTDEYILKLQIHQYSLLARKLFSRHNLSAQVFFSVSSRSSSSSHDIHLQVIFIFNSSSSGSGSSLDMDHHHWIWIITRSGSSFSGSRSSLDMDHHHWIWIIPRSGSYLEHNFSIWIIMTRSSRVLSHDSSLHRKFFRASPFWCWL